MPTAAAQVNRLVPPATEIQTSDLKDIQRKGWAGLACSPGSRALYWRLMLGLLSHRSSSEWTRDLSEQVADYGALKREILPDIFSVAADPLSHMVALDESRGTHSDEWNKYFETKEALKLIMGDLDRLYLTGVDDDYFRCGERRQLLESVLFIWSARHEGISYRQGMHEIAGTVLLAVDKEFESWTAAEHRMENSSHPLYNSFSKANTEAYTFWLFERIMKDLSPLYDPAVGADGQPGIVQYCANIQENLLRRCDPELCDFLESQFIQSQLYGMRWARLMLGREFCVTDSQVLRIWDYIFACCLPPPCPDVHLVDPLSAELLAPDGLNQDAVYASHARYGPYNPMLAMLGNFMLAMLLHIREDLVGGDVSTALALLMRYPTMTDITPIIDFADMLRRGVLDPGAHVGRIMDGGLLGDTVRVKASSPPKELKVRLREVARPMLSMGRRMSQSFSSGGTSGESPSGSSTAQTGSSSLAAASEDHSNAPHLNLSKTPSIFSSFRINRTASPEKAVADLNALTGAATSSEANKMSLFQTRAIKPTTNDTIKALETRVALLLDTQRFVGDCVLEIIGDLERTIISGDESADAAHGDTNIIKLKELVRVLCEELSIAEYKEAFVEPPPEDIPRRRNASMEAMASLASKQPVLVTGDPLAIDDIAKIVVDDDLEGSVADHQQPGPPSTTRKRYPSVSEMLNQPDSDDDINSSPRACPADPLSA